MDAAVTAWLLAQLGTSTDRVDLATRFLRLRTARQVALEVLYERKAALVNDQPATLNVSSVIAVGYTENIKALERQIIDLAAGIPLAPDEDDPDGDGTANDNRLQIVHLVERPRR